MANPRKRIPTYRITFDVPEELYAAAIIRANRAVISFAEWMRRAILLALEVPEDAQGGEEKT